MTESGRGHPRHGPPALGTLLARRLGTDMVGDSERRKIVSTLFFQGRRQKPFLNRFLALMTLSVLIAVFGVLADSTAVVIGAMLVAPLMAPVLALAVAIVMDWPARIVWAAAMTGAGVVAAVIPAAAASFLVPGTPDPIPSELMARTAPTLMDLGVALVAGAAGAYSLLRRQAADAFTGVAVAVSLVPPLATVGITIEMQEWELAIGASLLFITNVSGIITAAAVTFVLCGLVPLRRLRSDRVPIARGMRLAAAVTVLIVFPVQLVDHWLDPKPVGDDQRAAAVEDFIEAWRPDLKLLSVAVEQTEEQAEVLITMTENALPVEMEELATSLAKELGATTSVEILVLEGTSDAATGHDS